MNLIIFQTKLMFCYKCEKLWKSEKILVEEKQISSRKINLVEEYQTISSMKNKSRRGKSNLVEEHQISSSENTNEKTQ